MAAPSPLDRLRAAYRAYAARPTQSIEVPVLRAAAGDLRVVYKEPDWTETEEIKREWLANPDIRAPLNAGAEMLVRSCIDIQVRDGDTWLPGLGLDKGDMSYHQAAVELGLPVGDDPLAAVFALLASDWEVQRHNDVVATWEPSAPSPEVEDAFVGESQAAPSSTS